MTALILRTRVRADILSKADRILRELGYPEPPLRLEDVRELLKLDRSFFTGESDGLLKTAFSRLKRAGKQLLKRPTLLGEAIKKFDLRALYLPDQKRILIDDSIPQAKHRWLEAHEIGQHPNDFHNEHPDFRHMIPSPAFARMFDMPGIERMKSEIRLYCSKRRGPLGAGNVVLNAQDGSRHEFRFETFWNGYDALTPGVHTREIPTVIVTNAWGTAF